MSIDVVTPEVVNALAKRVERLENEFSTYQHQNDRIDEKVIFADNDMVAREFAAFLAAQGISGAPVQAEELQRLIGLNDDPNEFSHGIIEMRKE